MVAAGYCLAILFIAVFLYYAVFYRLRTYCFHMDGWMDGWMNE